MTTWMARWSVVSAIVTESTRNGMSSVTISITLWPAAAHSLSSTLGVNTRTLAVPWGRLAASRKWLIAAP